MRLCGKPTLGSLLLLAALSPVTAALDAQVTVHPRQVVPAAWERYTLSVVNATEIGVERVRIEIPDAITVLGVVPIPNWRFEIVAGTDTTAQFVEWSGPSFQYPELGEFAFLGRVVGDAREKTMVFPVRVSNASGTQTDYRGRPGSVRAAPTVDIVGRTVLSVRGAVALGGAAIGLAALALALSVMKGSATSHRT